MCSSAAGRSTPSNDSARRCCAESVAAWCQPRLTCAVWWADVVGAAQHLQLLPTTAGDSAGLYPLLGCINF
jgi:hypothetical protein